jgi:hypothetical protein
MVGILERAKTAAEVLMHQPAREGYTTRRIEGVTSKFPSGLFLTLGIGGILTSAGLAMSGKKEKANFFGLWVPTFLILGLYNKLVKQHGSD